jgi:hypothetical protein
VRGGAILPLGPVVQHTAERPLDEVTLQIYPEGASRFELYEDDGRSNAYRRGRSALTPITCDARADRVTIRVGSPTGDPSVVSPNRRYVIRLRLARPAAVAVKGVGEVPEAGAEAPAPAWWMDDAGVLCIRPRELPTFTVVVRLAPPSR